MSVNEKMTAIADSIRDKTGSTEALTLDGMASGVNEVYKAGEQAQRKDFWHNYLKHSRETANPTTTMAYRFAYNGWTDDTFYPTEDIYVKYGNMMFYFNKVTNIKQRLEDCGVKLIFDGANDAGAMFEQSSTTEIPTLELNKLTNPSASQRLCYYCSNLVLIEKIVSAEGTLYGNSFFRCYKLADITFDGVIGTSISFSDSPLTVESIISVITHLKNYNETEKAGKYTLTLKDTCKTLMAAQGAIDEFGKKTYDAYIADIGWNLA